MKKYFAPEALLPQGWRSDVLICIDERGGFAAVSEGASRDGAERLAGPVLPGMANLHSHAFQRAMAGLAEVRAAGSDDFWSWRELMYRFVSRLTPEAAQAVATQLYVEMLKGGYTALAEFHYVHNDPAGRPYAQPAEMLLRHLSAARDAGIAITLLPSLYRWSDFGSRPLQDRQRRFDSGVADVQQLYSEARRHAGPDVNAGVAPHSLRAVDPGALRELVAGLDAKAPIHIHAAEQTKEVDACSAELGARPVEWLLEHMDVDRRWCLVHATHMTQRETASLAASGAVAGLCPTTEGNLGDGIFPLLDYRAHGGRWGVGGDSHVSREAGEELRLLEYVQRLVVRRRNLVADAASPGVASTLWREAAAGGAQALARPMGALAPGLRADLVVLDGGHCDLAGRKGDAIAGALVFSGSANLVRDVMVGGAWVVKDRHHDLEQRAAQDYKKA
ncbi:MAG TPA: formimidoylglutamate deiminase, partial [Burkholderiales bacterium]|nr:formimidoylglutamate deiminase [Burkholderiales bacterium]